MECNKDPYTPNVLTQDDGKVMNIDRLNVSEANIPSYPQSPSDLPQGEVAPQNPDVYIRDQRNDYVPNYVAPNEVVPYSQGLPKDSTPMPKQGDDVNMIQNSPILTSDNVIGLSAVGMGVAPESPYRHRKHSQRGQPSSMRIGK